jgi:hypothetical protein
VPRIVRSKRISSAASSARAALFRMATRRLVEAGGLAALQHRPPQRGDAPVAHHPRVIRSGKINGVEGEY